MRAVEYVRVSTDHQQYSIVNQQAAIAEYALRHGFDVAKTYADPAKSGLDIRRRPGLQALIADVLSGQADFKAVLVLDVSRWGRFQDSDEAACYEFLCKRAGISVHYCAEAFTNDGSLASTFLKMVKRTMAAEYLRELSAKVFAGQCRLAAKGYKLGGPPGYGLRRLLLDSEGKPKMILLDGERKSLATERVTWVPGPPEEIQVVRDIFEMFVERDMSIRGIARVLRERNVPRGQFGPWDHQVVGKILAHPKYCGLAVFNRRSMKLGGKTVFNPREQWIVAPGNFEPLVSQKLFEQAERKLGNLTNRRSNERLLKDLRAFAQSKGRLSAALLTKANGMPGAST